jgi:hypothetical protein
LVKLSLPPLLPDTHTLTPHARPNSLAPHLISTHNTHILFF